MMVRSLILLAILSAGVLASAEAQRRGDTTVLDTSVVRPCAAVATHVGLGRPHHAIALPLELRLPPRWHRDTIIRDAASATERWSGPGARRLVLTSVTDSAARDAFWVGRFYTNTFTTATGDTVVGNCAHCGETYVQRCLIQGPSGPSVLAYLPFRAAGAPAHDTWARTWAGSDRTPWIFAWIESPDSADQRWARAALLTAKIRR